MRDVVVIGGGPGGLAAARSLASRGWDVAVFEEHDAIGSPVHCTGVLAADAIASLDLPAESLLNPLATVTFVAPSGHTFEYTTPRTEAVVIDRALLDAGMAAQAERAGATLVKGCRITSVEPGPSGVRMTGADGRVEDARAVILACGASYVFQRRLGLGMPAQFLHSAQMELPAERLGNVEVHFGSQIAPKSFAWVVPVRRPHGTFARIGVMCDGDAVGFFEKMLARVGERWGVAIPEERTPRRRMLPLGSITQTFGDRVLAVGDAAGLVKPTTGGGIYYSAVSGTMAADVLHARLAAGDLSAGALREYEEQWRSRFQAEFDAQNELRAVAERMNDDGIDALFDLAKTDGILPLVRQKARFNQHRDFIVALLRHQPARKALFGHLTGIQLR